MAKITALPPIDPETIDGSELVPAVKDGETGLASLAQLAQPMLAAALISGQAATANLSEEALDLEVATLGGLTFATATLKSGVQAWGPYDYIPSRALLKAVRIKTAGGACNVTIVVMGPCWRGNMICLATTTVDLPITGINEVDMGNLKVPAGSRLLVRWNSGAGGLLFQTGAPSTPSAWQMASWAAFSGAVGGVVACSPNAGNPFSIEVDYIPIGEAVDSRSDAAAALAKLQDIALVEDRDQIMDTHVWAEATGIRSVTGTIDAGVDYPVGAIISHLKARISVASTAGTSAEHLRLTVFERDTAGANPDTVSVFQDAGLPIRTVVGTAASLGLPNTGALTDVTMELLPIVLKPGKSYTYVLTGGIATDGPGIFGVGYSDTFIDAARQRRKGFFSGGAAGYVALTKQVSVGFGLYRQGVTASLGASSGIDALDAQNMAQARTYAERTVSFVQKPTAQDNLHIVTGQSLALGALTQFALSTAGRFGNKMLGGNVNTSPFDATNYTTVGAAVWNDMIAVPKDSAAVYANIDPPPADAVGEPWNLAWLNMGKFLLNQQLMTANDARRFVTINTAIGGKTIEQISKVNAQDGTNRWGKLTDGIAKAKAASVAEGRSIVCSDVLFGQGEYDYTAANGSTNTTRALYKAKLSTYFDDIAAETIAQLGQERGPAIFTYSAGGVFTADVDGTGAPDLHVAMAQLELAIERPDVFMVGAPYPYSDKDGGHLDANGSRWFGSLAAKVKHIVQHLGRDWSPLRPLWVQLDGDSIFIGFHVPEPPLVFDGCYGNAAAPVTYANKGFRVIDLANGNATVASSVTLVGKTVVRIDLLAGHSTNLGVYYADKTVHNGQGNLRDSDPAVALDSYFYDAAYMAADDNIPALVGKPYPLWNWCVPFFYPVGFGLS